MAFPEWSTQFLASLESSPSVSDAASMAGVTRQAAYRYRRDNPDFAAAWDDALAVGVEALEKVAFDRAKATSDTLLIFLLKSHKPERYGDRAKAPEWVDALINAIQRADARKSTRSAGGPAAPVSG